jgi:hypothetical protein
MRSGLDGSSENEPLVTSDRRIVDLDIDAVHGFLYWSEFDAEQDHILRSRLDGSDVEDLFTLPETHFGAIEVDGENGRLFWSTDEGIFVANLDASNAILIHATPLNGFSWIRDFDLDPSFSRVYWLQDSLGNEHTLGWTKTDGSRTEEMLRFQESVGLRSILVDPDEQQVYWVQERWDNNRPYSSIWQRSTAMSAQSELVLETPGRISSLTLGPRETASSTERIGLPGRFMLHHNYPNPFNAATKVRYDIREPADVELRVYDVLGQLVDILDSGHRVPGTYTITWEPSENTSGVYFVRLQSDRAVDVKRMVYIK